MNTLKLELQQAEGNGDPTNRRIQARAYELFLARGQTPGYADDDWIRAEQELRGESTNDDAADEEALAKQRDDSQRVTGGGANGGRTNSSSVRREQTGTSQRRQQ